MKKGNPNFGTAKPSCLHPSSFILHPLEQSEILTLGLQRKVKQG